MSHNLNSEQLAQRIYDCRLLENQQIDTIFAQIGGRGVDVEEFKTALLREELLTNWQLTRLLDGHKRGFIYGKWKVLYLVGSGTFARVYRACHTETNDIKAVKVLRNRYANDLDTQESFMTEALTVMKLRHPNIVPIYEVDKEHSRTYMVMDFIEGQNLRDFVKTHKRLKLSTALSITRDVASALKYSYSQGVTHRDIKLSNVLLSTSGRASLVDFGLAVINDEVSRGDGINPRSVDYAGLEKTTNVSRNDKRSDIFFLGCLLYHMVTGEPPLVETRERMVRMSSARFREIKPITTMVPNLPHHLVVLNNHLMALNPEQRIQTPEEAVYSIERVIKAIKAGDDRRYSEEASQRDMEAYQRKTQKLTEGEGHAVMVVDSHAEVQDLLRSKLKNLGYRVLVINDPVRALQRFEGLDPAEEKPADCVIFGCVGLGGQGVEAFNHFAENPWTQNIPSMLLVKESQAEFKSKAKLSSDAVCVTMPIKFRQIRAQLRKLLKIKSDDSVVQKAAADD